ncbi:MAG: hypothetical protein HQK97_06535 [Nitrospirae bacterium]|nr:hypothetical protein [Nitrospirota bacterium]
MAENDMDNQDVEYSSLKLDLAGDWLVSDFELLLNVIKNTYQTFYAINDIELSYKKSRDSMIDDMERFRHISPFWDDLYYRLIRDFRGTGVLPPFMPWSFQRPAVDYRGIGDTIQKGNWYIKRQDHIRIRKIAMSSPGIIEVIASNFSLKEVREFYKDISFRNEQEKELGKESIKKAKLDNEISELNIIEKKIHILERLNMAPDEIRKIVFSLDNNGKQIEEFYEKGMLYHRKA